MSEEVKEEVEAPEEILGAAELDVEPSKGAAELDVDAPEGTQEPSEEVVPPDYEFKYPEGFPEETYSELISKFKEHSKEDKLTQEQAQGNMDFAMYWVNEVLKKNKELDEAQHAEWEHESSLAGHTTKEALREAAEGLRMVDPTGTLRKALVKSGIQKHHGLLHMAREFRRLNTQSSGTMKPGTGPAPKRSSTRDLAALLS